MDKPLMPKAVAIWLIENTSLTFEQIAKFCGMHPLEIKGIADGEVANGILPMSPINSGELTLEEIKKSELDPSRELRLSVSAQMHIQPRKKNKYTPVARRQDKPDAIAWFVKNYPDVKDSLLCKLLGTTKTTIEAIRNRSHWNIQNIRPKDPVLLGICSQTELDKILAKTNLEKKDSQDSSEE